MLHAFLLCGGLALLVLGADCLVRGAAKLAAGLGIAPLLVGLTIVAYGTSAPELAVSLQSSWAGQADVALGNVVGSNIFNVLVILGLSALVAPLQVVQQLIRFDVPVMIVASLAVYGLARDGLISTGEAVLLALGAIAYTALQVWQARRGKAASQDSPNELLQPERLTRKHWLFNLGWIGLGVGLLIGGSRALVTGAIAVAQLLGASQLIIGLTIVAAGTSLPELATSIVATCKGERDIAVGNVIGSNIFNLLAVLGFSGVASGSGIAVAPLAIQSDLPVMIAVAIACLPIFWTGSVISRWEGGAFLGYYAAYVAYLGLRVGGAPGASTVSIISLWLLMPLVVITLLSVVPNLPGRRKLSRVWIERSRR